jgi:uncharacterized protein (DUF2252 family)
VAEQPSMTRSERADRGRAVRKEVPRTVHGDWFPATDRRPAVELLAEQEATRVPELVPLRHERMAESAFAFYRGAANIMAADLAPTPRTGLGVQLCGDGHLANFGGFASPDRAMVFDINDFDETLPGPFEWDVKRLAASFEVAARSKNLDEGVRQQVVRSLVDAYSASLREFSTMGNLELWYSRLTSDDIVLRFGGEVSPAATKRFEKAITKAQSKNNLKAFNRLTEVVDGEPRFRSDPPVLMPVDQLVPADEAHRLTDVIGHALTVYRRTLQRDRRHLLERYRFVDLARKVVGVGSVGTRCWVALLVGADEADPLFLQVKEAEASVLEPYLGRSGFEQHGQRVVEGQRLTQAASDIFLGWERLEGVDGVSHDYYFRQLWDWKFSADIESMEPETLGIYAQICGSILARSHARTGDGVAISAYVGRGGPFAEAMVRFAHLYADQNELDHQAFVETVGRS